MNPRVIYDIGASDGGWTRDMKRVFPHAKYEEFEANTKYARPGCHSVLLGNTEKDVTFYKPISGSDTGASIYLEVSQHYVPGSYVAETLSMVPLDVYATRNNLLQPDLIKLDVQGAELDVLKGATSILRNTLYIVMEVSLHRWNTDAPMIEDVVAFMALHGFEIIDIADTHITQGYLFQVDVIFAHKTTGLRKQDFYLR